MKKNMRSKKKWFKPKKETGWSKTQSPSTRRRKLLESTDKRKSPHDRYVEAGRRIQALANVTEDKATAKRAKQDADYFFKKAQKTK